MKPAEDDGRRHHKLPGPVCQLTEAGHAFVAASRTILEDMAQAEQAASGEYLAPTGQLTTRTVLRCASSSATLRLTVGSGMCSVRAAAERLPLSAARTRTDMASRRSIRSYRK
jgi:hypothetical protein